MRIKFPVERNQFSEKHHGKDVQKMYVHFPG